MTLTFIEIPISPLLVTGKRYFHYPFRFPFHDRGGHLVIVYYFCCQGLDRAIEDLYPAAEHRFCVRHIYQNMRRTWKAKEYKDYLWRCATATTVPEFEAVMNELSIFDNRAYEWLLKIPAHHWARSHFSGMLASPNSLYLIMFI